MSRASPLCAPAEPRYDTLHEGGRQAYPQHLARAGRLVGRRHRPDHAAAPIRYPAADHPRPGRPRHPLDADPRCAADRRDGGIRHLPCRQGGRLGRGAGTRLCDAAYDAADRDQPEMGARRDAGGPAQPDARGAGCGRLPAGERDCRRGCRHQPGDRASRRETARGDCRRQEAGRAGQCADALQCRLARHRRCRHRDRVDLRGPRPGAARACLGRRNPAAQSGRLAHRLGTRPARRAAHRDPGQHRGPPDAARHGRHRDRRHRPGDGQRRRVQQDRHLSQGAGGARQRRAVLCRAAVTDHRLHRLGRHCRNSDRGARARRGYDHDRAGRPTAGSRRCGWCPTGRR